MTPSPNTETKKGTMTLADIENQRDILKANYDRYTAALDTVAELLSAAPHPPCVVTALPATAAQNLCQSQPKPRCAPKKRMVKTKADLIARAAGAIKPPRETARCNAALKAVAAMSEPFTTRQVGEALVLTDKGASSQLLRWKRAGYVRAITIGKYERTITFPAPVPARFIDGLDEPTTEQKLAKARADLIEAGPTLAAILRDKIAKLENTPTE